MTKREIKNCPFCGDFAECTAATSSNGYLKYKVECCECLCQTGLYDHPEFAIEKWNVRLRSIEEKSKNEEIPILYLDDI